MSQPRTNGGRFAKANAPSTEPAMPATQRLHDAEMRRLSNTFLIPFPIQDDLQTIRSWLAKIAETGIVSDMWRAWQRWQSGDINLSKLKLQDDLRNWLAQANRNEGELVLEAQREQTNAARRKFLENQIKAARKAVADADAELSEHWPSELEKRRARLAELEAA